ncbi:MAG TPA: carboxypeptidase regulatory-like domain-containing protein [Planctomycetota bacterium]|nr:carboxypeptidase regulatory-like domain-containing protein [Planctomycetota bacterium]
MVLALLGAACLLAWWLLRPQGAEPGAASVLTPHASDETGDEARLAADRGVPPETATSSRGDVMLREREASTLVPPATTRTVAGHVLCGRPDEREPRGDQLAAALSGMLRRTLAGVRVRPVPASARLARSAPNAPILSATSGGGELAPPPSADGRAPDPVAAGMVTNDDGAFVLSGVPSDCSALDLSFADDPTFHVTRPLPDITGDIEGLVLMLDPGITWTGTVTTYEGTPIAGAIVGFDNRPLGVTNASGSFELPRQRMEAPLAGQLTYAEADGFARAFYPFAFTTLCCDRSVTPFLLARAGSIEGTVTDDDGLPVAGVDVGIKADLSRLDRYQVPTHLTTTTGDDGRYRLSGVPASHYLLQVGAAQYESLLGVAAAQDPSLQTLSARDPLRTLRVRTRPGPGTIRSASGESWRALASRWITGVAVTADETTHLDVVLDGGASVEGQVTDEHGGPLARAAIVVRGLWRWPQSVYGPRSPWLWMDGLQRVVSCTTSGEALRSAELFAAVTDAAGRYRIELLPAGEFLLMVPSARGSAAMRIVRLDGGQRLDSVDIVVGEGVTLRGHVLDVAGRPVPEARLTVWPMGATDFMAMQTSSDVEGRFEIARLPEVELVLSVYGNSNPSWPHETYMETLTPDGAPLDIHLKALPR